jgi:hypothetical protein
MPRLASRKGALSSAVVIAALASAMTAGTATASAERQAAPTGLRETAVDGIVTGIEWDATAGAATYYVYSGNDLAYATTSTHAENWQLYLRCVIFPNTTDVLAVKARGADGTFSAPSRPLTVAFPPQQM